jgi:hypothetical protein
VTEREALQNAADEARKAARAGREFAGLLDEYAKFLMQPNWRQRAEEYHRSALNKLNVINEGLAVCHKLIEESTEAAAVADSMKKESQRQAALSQQSEKEVTVKKAASERPERRPVRIAKKAVGK